MGSTFGNPCCPCLVSLQRLGQRRFSRSSGRLAGDMVRSPQEALRIVRPQEGTWKPSPSSSSGLNHWTSPVPPAKSIAAGHGAESFEFVLADFDHDVPKLPELRKRGSQEMRTSKYEVEQLLASPGSLPRPMGQDEREEAIRALRPTATYEMLAKVPRIFLEAATKEAQELRRSLVRGATVVFVSAGYPGKRFCYERAAALGVKSVIIDHPDSWSKSLVDEGIIAKFLPVDMSQSGHDVYLEAAALIKQLGDDGLTGPVDGITTFVELAVGVAARLCEAFGLPGFRPGSVDAARDKYRTREVVGAAGLATIRHTLIRGEPDLAAAGQHVGFPAILKPVSGAASLGVKKVASMNELHSRYREVVEALQSLIVSSGALIEDDGSGGVSALKVVDLSLILEQYLDGKEVDVDLVMSDGEWRYAAITDNGPTVEPYFPETWGVCPSLLSKNEQKALKDFSVDCAKALGFTSGVLHVECKYTSSGPQLLEVNARMGGGPVHRCNQLVWGVDLVEEAIFCALGIPARPYVPSEPLTCVAYDLCNAPKSGVLRSTSGIEALRLEKGVVSADALVKAGDKVVGAEDGMPSWLAAIMVERGRRRMKSLVTAKTSGEALEHVLRLEQVVQSQVE